MAQSGARSWGTYANAASLPNVSASETTELLQGDFANVSGVGLYQCDDPTPGSAVWSVIGGGGGTADIQGPRIVVGCSAAPYNDTLDDCDYLDTGDGAQLQAAITAAGVNKYDVWIRPGVYDYSTGAVDYIVIPAGVKVRGSGRGSTIIRNNHIGYPRVFRLYEKSELEDVSIEIQKPTGDQEGTSNALVRFYDDGGECRRVSIVLIDGPWSAEDITNFSGRRGFYSSTGSGEYIRIKDCDCDASAMGTLSNLFECFSVGTGGSDHATYVDLIGCRSFGGDKGFAIYGISRISNCGSYDANSVGIMVDNISYNRKDIITDNFIRLSNSESATIGIHLDHGIHSVVSGNEIYNAFGSAGGTGIECNTDHVIINGNNIMGNWTANLALNLTANAQDCVVVANDFNSINFTNSGGGTNVIASNHL